MADYKYAKRSQPSCGVALIDPTMTRVLLVQGVTKPPKYGFPKGKMEIHEDPFTCALRELHEETGLYGEPFVSEQDHLVNRKQVSLKREGGRERERESNTCSLSVY